MRRHWTSTAALAATAVLLIPSPSWAHGKEQKARGPSAAAVAAPAALAPAPTTDCTAYTEHRQFVDAQGWWTQTPGRTGNNYGHIHVGACIPEREVVRGTIPLDVRIILHDNPGTFRYLAVVVKGKGYETTVAKPTVPNFTCPTGTCTQWIHYDLDTRAFQASGRQEIRLRALLDTPDGQAMHGGLNFQVIVDNRQPKIDFTREPQLRGKGWYTGAGYCESTFTSVPIPDAPLSGTWSPGVYFGDHPTGQTDDPVTHHSVRLDADFHAGIPGIVLRDADGEFRGNVTVDTRKLANGPHRLMLKADCDDIRGSTNSGVLVIPFEVRN